MNEEIQNYSLGPQCSPHKDSWINTEIAMGKERDMCVLHFAFFMCVIALLGVSPAPVHPRQMLRQRATSESPPHFCCPFIYQWTLRPIYYIQFCTVGSNNHGVQAISFLLISFPQNATRSRIVYFQTLFCFVLTCVFACIFVWHRLHGGAHGNQKQTSDLLDLAQHVVMSHQVGAGN